MKKITRKVIALVCVAMLLAATCLSSVTFASDIIFDLNSLGITSGLNFESRLDSYITRGEFSQLVVNMMGQKDVALTMAVPVRFNDVTDNAYAGAINLLNSQGIVSGTGDGNFEPDRYVRYTEACKMLVKVLGYDVIVSDTSLESFMYMAGTIGITANVNSANEYLTIQDMFTMIDNCLDINKMVPMYYNTNISPSYEVEDGNTYRKDLMEANPEGTVKVRGVVTADVSSYLLTQRNSMNDNQIEVDGMIFTYDGEAPVGLVGMEVEMYVTTVDGEYGKVVSITATRKNTVTEIVGTDITDFTSDKIEYLIDDTALRKVSVNAATKYLYNNNLDNSFNPSELNYNNMLTVRAIDNDNDGIADVVFVFEYEDRIVQNVFTDRDVVALDSAYNGAVNLVLDEDDTTARVEYFDAKGNKSNYGAIEKDDVLSIAASRDGYSIRIVISKDRVKGFVEAKGDDYVTIDGTDYTYTADISGMRVGTNIEAWINFRGDIVDYKEINSSTDYAYVYGVQTPKSGLGSMQVKLLLPDSVASQTTEGEFDETTNSSSKITSLYVNNSEALVYYLDTKVKVDGATYTAEEAARLVNNTAVRYYLDSNSKINKFETLKPMEDAGKLKQSIQVKLTYNSSEKIFGKGDFAFGIDDKTLAVCVPVVNSANYDYGIVTLPDTDLLNYKMELSNNKDQIVSVYEVDEDTHIAPFFVVFQTSSSMASGRAGTLMTAKKYVGMVTRSVEEYDENTGESVHKITMYTIGKQSALCEQTFYVSDLISHNPVFDDISKGDLIRYSLDGFDRLDNAEKLKDAEDYDRDGQRSESGITTYTYSVMSADFDEIDESRMRWVDKIVIYSKDDPDTAVGTFKIAHTSSLAPVVFIVDSKGNAKIGSVKDICVNDRVCICKPTSLMDVTAIVIYR